MLDISANNLLQEIKSAKDSNKLKLNGVKDMVARYMGPSRAALEGAPVNHEFKYISLGLSWLAYSNPRVKISTTDVDPDGHVRALQVGMNRWIRDTDYRSVMRQSAMDFFFAWSVLLASERPAPELGEMELLGGTRGIAWRPYSKRIPYDLAFLDPLAQSPYDVRYAGHTTSADKDDLLREARDNPKSGWRAEVIRGLSDDTGVYALERDTRLNVPTRREIAYHQMWVRDAHITDDEFARAGIAKKDRHLYHGKLFFISPDTSSEEGAAFIRDPQLYYGPRWGPYTFIGSYLVPDESHYLSPLMPLKANVDALNRLVESANRSDEAYARMVFTNDETVASAIKNGSHDYVYCIDGFENKLAQSYEKGGSTTQQQAAIALRKKEIEEASGLTDAQRGAVGQANSASEAVIADASASARVGAIKQEFLDGHRRHLMTHAWYMWHDDEIAMKLSAQDAAQLGISAVAVGDLQPQPMFWGGGGPKDSFDSADLVIEPMSVAHQSQQQQQQRLNALIEIVNVVGPLVTNPAMAHVNWPLIERAISEAIDLPGMEEVFDLSVAAQIAQSQVLMAYAEQMQAQKSAHLSGDVGGGVLKLGNGSGRPREGGPNPTPQGKRPGRSLGSAAGKRAEGE